MTQRFPLFFTAVIGAAVLLSGCGGAASNTANSTNSSNANKTSNGNTNSNANTSSSVSSAPPLVKTIDELQLASEWMDADASETPGRIFKITGNLALANDERLIIGYGNSDAVAGNSITCKGDFSKYSGLEDKIKGLAKQNKAPKVVIEGKFSEREDDTITLDPCVLTEIPK